MLLHYGIEGGGQADGDRGPGTHPRAAAIHAHVLEGAGANAAVTVVHTGVGDWADITREADIVVGAAGSPNMITPDVIRPGAVVIGGGLTWEGRKAFSDVAESCSEVGGWITPRLGGVGVTTVAMLLRNTVAAVERHAGALTR